MSPIIGSYQHFLIEKHSYQQMCNRPDHIISGFRATGLCPFNKEAIPDDRCITSQAFEDNQIEGQIEDEPPTPRKLLRRAIVDAISPGESTGTQQAIAQSRKRRARVQKSFGECITEAESMTRLKEAEEKRKSKKSKIIHSKNKQKR